MKEGRRIWVTGEAVSRGWCARASYILHIKIRFVLIWKLSMLTRSSGYWVIAVLLSIIILQNPWAENVFLGNLKASDRSLLTRSYRVCFPHTLSVDFLASLSVLKSRCAMLSILITSRSSYKSQASQKKRTPRVCSQYGFSLQVQLADLTSSGNSPWRSTATISDDG